MSVINSSCCSSMARAHALQPCLGPRSGPETCAVSSTKRKSPETVVWFYMSRSLPESAAISHCAHSWNHRMAHSGWNMTSSSSLEDVNSNGRTYASCTRDITHQRSAQRSRQSVDHARLTVSCTVFPTDAKCSTTPAEWSLSTASFSFAARLSFVISRDASLASTRR